MGFQLNCLQILVGDADNGPLVAGDPPTGWAASVGFWSDDDGEEYESLAEVGLDGGLTPTGVVDALVPIVARAATREGRIQLDLAEQAAWSERHNAYNETSLLPDPGGTTVWVPDDEGDATRGGVTGFYLWAVDMDDEVLTRHDVIRLSRRTA